MVPCEPGRFALGNSNIMLKWRQTDLTEFFGVVAIFDDDAGNVPLIVEIEVVLKFHLSALKG